MRLLPDGAPWAGVQRLVSIEGPARASAFLRARRAIRRGRAMPAGVPVDLQVAAMADRGSMPVLGTAGQMQARVDRAGRLARRRAARHPDDDWQRRRAERAYGMAEGSAQFDRELDVEVAGRAANTIRL